GEAYEEVVKGMLTTLEQINKTLATIKDEPTAQAAQPELRKHGEKMKELRKRASELPQPSRIERDALEVNYKGQFEKALRILRTESIRVRVIPGGDLALKEIAVVDESKKPKE